MEDCARSDGQFFSAALQHVLGTLDPRIPSLGPWQAIEASNSDHLVIDLSGESFEGDGGVLGGMLDSLGATPEEEADLADILGELEMEQAMIGSWGSGTPMLDKLEAAMPAYRVEDHLDDLSRVSTAIDLSQPDYAADLVDQHYGPGKPGRLRERGAPRMVTALSHEIAREAVRRGDLVSAMSIYAETGVTGTGNAIDMANQPGRGTAATVVAGEPGG